MESSLLENNLDHYEPPFNFYKNLLKKYMDHKANGVVQHTGSYQQKNSNGSTLSLNDQSSGYGLNNINSMNNNYSADQEHYSSYNNFFQSSAAAAQSEAQLPQGKNNIIKISLPQVSKYEWIFDSDKNGSKEKKKREPKKKKTTGSINEWNSVNSQTPNISFGEESSITHNQDLQNDGKKKKKSRKATNDMDQEEGIGAFEDNKRKKTKRAHKPINKDDENVYDFPRPSNYGSGHGLRRGNGRESTRNDAETTKVDENPGSKLMMNIMNDSIDDKEKMASQHKYMDLFATFFTANGMQLSLSSMVEMAEKKGAGQTDSNPK